MLIRLDKDSVTPELRRLIRAFSRPRSVFAAGAKAVQKAIIDHLVQLQARGNKRGWPSQKFFAGGPDSVRKHVGIASLSDSGAVVSIADPRFYHRITGGPVSPKRRKALAIPLTAQAYAASGKGSLRESIPGLVVVKTAKGAWLALPTDNRGKGKDQLRFLFRLLPRVTHRPHPEDLPDQAAIADAAMSAMSRAAKLLASP